MTTQPAVLEPGDPGVALVPAREAEAVGRSALRKASLRLLPLMGLGYGIAYMDRVNVSFAALQMNRQLHFTQSVFGLGAGLFFLSYAACEIPSNLLLVRFGARRWLARIMLTWGLLSMSMIFVRTPAQFCVMRLLLGVAEAGFFPGVIFYLAQWFPAGERSRAVSRFYIALPLSSTVMGALAGSLLGLNGRLGLAGWQWLLLMEGVPAVLMSAVFLLTLPNGPAEARWLSEPERNWIVDRLVRERALLAGVRSEHHVTAAFRDLRVWLLGFFLLCLLLGIYGYTFIAPQLIEQVTHWTTGEVGGFIAALGVLGAVAMLAGGWLADRTGRRYTVILIPLLFLTVGYFASGFSVRAIIVLPALAIITAGFMAVQGPVWAIPPTILQGKSAAAGIATINMISVLGGFLGPYWMGVMTDLTGNFRRGLLTLAAPTLLSVILLTVMRPGLPTQPKAEQE